jgi:hypothetical protein
VSPRASVGAVLASALRKVVGGRLKQSNLGEVWRDDRSWLELARELDAALKGRLVLVDGEHYKKLVADAEQMRLVRAYLDEYKSRLSKEKQQNGIRNPYARWAAENMPPKEESK